jgi:chemotaxis protein methyltransferase CheR
VTPADFDFLRKLLKDRSGLMLSGDKQYLLESRLLPVARKNGLASLGELAARLKAAPHSSLATQVVDAMTTNETFFFRDKLPFEYFRGLLLPALLAARAGERRLRIWCAACANGQEPYSLAMSLRELGPALGAWKIEILATDISNEALEKARAGLYSQFEVQRGLPIALLLKYFVQNGEMWQITPDVRAMVAYRPFNLLNDFSSLGTFDVIFCRNVLIYFDQPTKIGVLNRLAHAAADDGYLVLGAAETTIGLTDAFKPLHEYRGVYVPNVARIPYVAAPPLAVTNIRGSSRAATTDGATAKRRQSSPP